MKIARRIVLILAVVAMLVAGLVIPASAAAVTGTFEKYSGALTEGYYIIVYGTNAMKNTVSSNRFGNGTVTNNSTNIVNPDESIVWKIEQNGNNWTIYNEAVSKYAAGNGTKNQGKLVTTVDDYAKWTVTGTSTYEFENVGNRSKNVNANLRNNGTYGFACYSTGTGGALTLYKLVEEETPSACQHTNTTPVANTAKAATCTDAGKYADEKCNTCGETIVGKEIPATGHNYVGGICTVCDTEQPNEVIFELGANGNAEHKDGSTDKATYTEKVGDYELEITGGSKMYPSSYDAKGNSCIKLGTSSAVGSFTFTVPSNVTSVVIYAAKYKTNTSKITVNGTSYTLSNASDNGAYDEIIVDTTSTKTVSFTTVSGGVRCMVNAIKFIYEVADCEHSYDEEVTNPATCTEDGVKTYTCSKCSDSYTEAISKTGHSYSEEVTKPATCTEDGLMTYTCSKCSDSYTKTISAAGCKDANDDGKCDDCNEAMPVWKKVVNTDGLSKDGKYLIVYIDEAGNAYAFNGSLTTLDDENNYVAFAAANVQNSFTLVEIEGGWAIKSASGLYIGQTKDDNGLVSQAGDSLPNTISFNADGTVNIVSGGAYLRYNAASNQERFRYYKSSSYTGQKAIYLYKLVENDENDPKLTGVSLNIGSDLDMNVYAQLPEGFTSASITFNNGTPITGIAGENKYTFTGITPDKLGDKVTIILSVVVDGVEYKITKEYSILDYCEAYAKKENKNDAMMTLLADLMVYGKYTMLYNDANADVTAINTLLNGDYAEFDAAYDFDADDYSAYTSANYLEIFRRATLVLDNKVDVRFTLNVEKLPEGATVEAWIGGTSDECKVNYTLGTIEVQDEGEDPKTVQTITVTDVMATEFDKEVVVRVTVGENVYVLYYSVNTYCAEMLDDARVTELCKAIYNYGKAAEAYVDAN